MIGMSSLHQKDPGEVEIAPKASETIIEVLDCDSLQAGKWLLDEGYNPAVLNFANRNTPGGGVEYGEGAQEENIFRRSNPFMSLYQFHHNGEARGVPHITEMERCESFNTPPGYWTDDSSMAFCIAESAVRLQRYSLEDIANNFVRWYRDGFWSSLSYAFDVGNATCDAIHGIERGMMKNGSEGSQGNGSIMRFAPSFILNYGNTDYSLLYEISDLTHDSQKVREAVALMAKICEEHIKGQRASVKSIYNSREEVNNSGWAVSTLQAALWAFETTSTFEDGMVAAVNLGGDADSIGAVYGQVAGAYYGFNAIPERWLCKIKDRDAVNGLIEGCVKLNPQAGRYSCPQAL